ncbi:MAG: hypothetical protein Q8761_03015 [Sweet potato little leaf phytoplasma]|nr:hypothetical protein [Sweet potato little leaf phytoplasma]
MTRSDLILIDPFNIDTKEVSPPVPFAPTDSATESDTLVDETSTSVSPMTTQSSPEVADDPPPRRSTRVRKSTKLPDFVYSSYSNSFASFVASIHRLSEPLSFREAICDPLWQDAMVEELTALMP